MKPRLSAIIGLACIIAIKTNRTGAQETTDILRKIKESLTISNTVGQRVLAVMRSFVTTFVNEKDECKIPDLCKNGGTCLNSLGSYSCVCADGYEGKHCETETNECQSQPCLNGGVCTDMVANFTCNCEGTGYEGLLCQLDIDECFLNHDLCRHNRMIGSDGKCKNLPGN